MRRFGCMLLAVLVSPLLLLSTVLAQNNGGLQFTLTDLGTFGGGDSIGNAINNNGQIVGFIDVNYGTKCFSWQPGGSSFVFDGGTKQPTCRATAVSMEGNIAGNMISSKSPYYAPFRRDANGRLGVLPPLPGSLAGGGFAWGISKSTVVGESGYPPVAVKWDYYGNPSTLLNTTSRATAINSKGHIVGGTWGNAWIWQNGSVTYLPASGAYAWAYTIHNNDTIGGYTYVTGSTCATDWYAYFLTDLDCGSQVQPAVGIASDGWVIAGRNEVTGHCGPLFDANSSERCANLIVPGCSVADLNTLLDSSGTGWVLYEAAGINDAHQIVANGLSPVDGAVHAVLLTPNNLPLCYVGF